MKSNVALSYGAEKSARDTLVESNTNLVKIIAHQMANKLPGYVDLSDLMSAGTIGLIEAANRFDGTKGVGFNTYASIRIRGAMLDELRRNDWMTRSMRDKANHIERAYHDVEAKRGRRPEYEEVASHLNISVDNFHSMMSEVKGISVTSLEDLKGDSDMNILECISDPDTQDPTEVVSMMEVKDKLEEIIESFPEKERMAINLYYCSGLTYKEIGEILEVSESRVCQLHKKAMRSIRARLKKPANLRVVK